MKNKTESETPKNLPSSAPVAAQKPRLGEWVGNTFIPIVETVSRGEPVWQVRVSGTGKTRKYRTFHTLKEARDFARALGMGLACNSKAFATISPAQVKTCCLVAASLAPFCKGLGISPRQAIEEYIEAKNLAPAHRLEDIVKDFLSQPWARKSRTPLSEVIDEYIASQGARGCRPATLQSLRYALKKLVEMVGPDTALGDVTTRHLDEFVHRPHYTPKSRRTVYNCVHALYSWLQRRGYLRPGASNALAALEKPALDQLLPQILDVPTARQLIQGLARHDEPEHLVALLLGLFAGVKPDEFGSCAIISTPEGKCIHVHSNKTNADRLIPILPPLDAWLAPILGVSGKLISRKRPMVALARTCQSLKLPWSLLWLRNSFCAYRLTATAEDLIITSRESGFGVDILAKRFRNRVTRSEAADYFALTPEACGIADWTERVRQDIGGSADNQLAA